jgi:hypothetical protein
MSGVIKVSATDDPGKTWMGASWAFEEVVHAVLEHRTLLSDEVAHRLAASVDPGAMLYLDLSSLTSSQLQGFESALRSVRDSEAKTKGSDWRDPEFWPGYFKLVESLLASVEADPRIPSGGSSQAVGP